MGEIKRRPTDPVPGTKGPKRGNNDTFKLDKAAEPKTAPPSYEGTLGKRRREMLDSVIETTATGKPRPFKRGGAVKRGKRC